MGKGTEGVSGASKPQFQASKEAPKPLAAKVGAAALLFFAAATAVGIYGALKHVTAASTAGIFAGQAGFIVGFVGLVIRSAEKEREKEKAQTNQQQEQIAKQQHSSKIISNKTEKIQEIHDQFNNEAHRTLKNYENALKEISGHLEAMYAKGVPKEEANDALQEAYQFVDKFKEFDMNDYQEYEASLGDSLAKQDKYLQKRLAFEQTLAKYGPRKQTP